MQPFSSVLIGAIGGLVVGLGLSSRWGNDMSEIVASANFATLLAGLGGASLGGLISFATSRQTSRETAKRDEETRLSAEKAQALSGLVKTMQLANRLFTLNNKLVEATQSSEGLQPWQMLQASVGQSNSAPDYTADDFIPFINAKHADFVHRALLLADRVDSLEDAYQTYSSHRLQHEQFMLPFSQFVEGAMVTAVPPESQTEFTYRANMLNKLIVEMADYCARDLADAKSLITEMNKAFLSYFKERANFRLDLEDGAADPHPTE